MAKNVNIEKLRKHWEKVIAETTKICVKHHDCMECLFHTIVKGDVICPIGSLCTAILNLNDSPNFAQVELPEIEVNIGEKE